MICANPDCPDLSLSGKPGEYGEGIRVCPKCGSTLLASLPRELAKTLGVEKKLTIGWYVEVLNKYAVFRGRAEGREFWWFFLADLTILVVLILVWSKTDNILPAQLYWLVTLLPRLAVLTRRLHDIGKTAWSLLLLLVPFIGTIFLLGFCTRESQPGPNMYGPNPKGIVGSTSEIQAVPTSETLAAPTKTIECPTCYFRIPETELLVEEPRCPGCGSRLGSDAYQDSRS